MDTSTWTYGAEHEWGDWAYNEPLPLGYGRDRNDSTIMSSNGVANDPKGLTYEYGGEINTPPTRLPEGQGACVEELIRHWRSLRLPAPTVNHRSNLHIHVRVPGLRGDLDALKRVQKFIHEVMPTLLPIIQPLPSPGRFDFPGEEEWKGAKRRWRRRRVSHQTLLTPSRLAKQLGASSLEEFFSSEVPSRSLDGAPQYHLQPRLCVNLRQLRETDTVEFRHFAGTLDPNQVELAARYCGIFLECALENDKHSLFAGAPDIAEELPKFPEYNHKLELRYRATCHDGTLSRKQIEGNIDRILSGEFD